jgi:hypothetical protein
MSNGLQKFRTGYLQLRPIGNPDAPSPESYLFSGSAKQYWLADESDLAWWDPELEWVVIDRGLGAVEHTLFMTMEELYAEVTRMWALVRPHNPNAVWDPFSWKWMVARKIPESARPEPGVPGPGPEPADPREKRRRERDSRIAEVNALYRAGSIGREVRDERIGEILDDYSDLN